MFVTLLVNSWANPRSICVLVIETSMGRGDDNEPAPTGTWPAAFTWFARRLHQRRLERQVVVGQRDLCAQRLERRLLDRAVRDGHLSIHSKIVDRSGDRHVAVQEAFQTPRAEHDAIRVRELHLIESQPQAGC